MKKRNIISLLSAVLFLILITACSGGLKSDAKKAADLACKAQKMAMDMDNMEDLQELQAEAASLYQKLSSKYQTPEEMQEFAEAYEKELGKCN